MDSGPRNIAHRGSSGRAPENTVLAMQLAIQEDGADGLELDLQISRDGEVVVLHDATVDRTTNGRGRASEYDLASLRRLDAGCRFVDAQGHAAFAGRGVTIPTLREVLNRFPDTWLSLDLKGGGDALQDRTLALLEEHDALDRAVIGDAVPARAARLRRVAPHCEHFFHRGDGVRFLVRRWLHCWWAYRAPARSMQIPTRAGAVRLDKPGLVAAAHARDIAVRFWTVNEVDEMQRLLGIGADGLITDYPGRLHQLLRGPARPSS